MSSEKPLSSPLSRRRFLAGSAALAASPAVFALPHDTAVVASADAQPILVAAAPSTRAGDDDGQIRPFRYRASDAELADLRRRVAATKWPSKELVSDATQGVQLAT